MRPYSIMQPHMVTASTHEFSSDMTDKIFLRVSLQRMQICLSPCTTGPFKSAPVGLQSHEVILAENKDEFPPHTQCIATGKKYTFCSWDGKSNQPEERVLIFNLETFAQKPQAVLFSGEQRDMTELHRGHLNSVAGVAL